METLKLKKVAWLLEELNNTPDEKGGIIINLLKAIDKRLENIDEYEDIEPSDSAEFVNIHHNLRTSLEVGVILMNPNKKNLIAELPAIIQRALKKPLPKIESRFLSVNDEELRDILDRDLLDAEQCLARGLWKPAMVLCGSVLEAVMYDYLRQNVKWTMDSAHRKAIPVHKGKSRDITKDDRENQWELAQLIDFFCENQLLDPKPDTWKTTIHNFIRQYRNLVHPMAEMRKQANQQVSMEAARQCYANLIAVLAVISKLPTPK